MAGNLARSEQALLDYCVLRKVQATVLRPTLVWGVGRDLTVSRIARLGAKRRVFVLPDHASGLRQPVHVADLANAAAEVVDRAQCAGKVYDLGGGETLSYEEMVQRIKSATPGYTPLIHLPASLVVRLVLWAQHYGYLKGFTLAAFQRMAQDLVFDIAPAQRDFGYAPRGFLPSAAELGLDQ